MAAAVEEEDDPSPPPPPPRGEGVYPNPPLCQAVRPGVFLLAVLLPLSPAASSSLPEHVRVAVEVSPPPLPLLPHAEGLHGALGVGTSVVRSGVPVSSQLPPPVQEGEAPSVSVSVSAAIAAIAAASVAGPPLPSLLVVLVPASLLILAPDAIAIAALPPPPQPPGLGYGRLPVLQRERVRGGGGRRVGGTVGGGGHGRPSVCVVLWRGGVRMLVAWMGGLESNLIMIQ